MMIENYKYRYSKNQITQLVPAKSSDILGL